MGEEGFRSSTSLARVRHSQDGGRSSQDEYRGGGAGKRLIVCCDGTWLDSNSGLQNGKIPPPSNVTRITRAINSQSEDGVQQIVYYQAGIGSQGTVVNKAVGGAFAQGLAENVREAYSFIAHNYSESAADEIFLIGFSRGAFTARSVGGLIGNIGVLTKEGLPFFPVIYKDFAHRYEKGYRSPQPRVPFGNKPSARSPEYARELERRGLTTLGVRIRAIAVFDTVGGLGIPQISWLGKFGQRTTDATSEYKFYDTTLDDCIDNAFQALALDEKRTPFQPAVWEKRGNDKTNLIQVWFPGVHANVGGGYNDQELANISLAWMMAMLSPLLDLNLDYVLAQHDLNEDYYEHKRKRSRPWSFGKIYNSLTGAFAVSGSTTRFPGDYYRKDPRTGEATHKPLRDTNEYIHASVRSRYVMQGPGYGDKGTYDPPALRDYELREDDVMGLPTPFFWEDRGPNAVVLPEAPLRQVERTLLRESPDVYDYIFDSPKPRRRNSRRP